MAPLLPEASARCDVQMIICLVDRKTGEKSKTRPRFVKQDQIAIMRMECAGVVCMEPFKEFPQMGRFTLRDEGECPPNHSAHPGYNESRLADKMRKMGMGFSCLASSASFPTLAQARLHHMYRLVRTLLLQAL